MLIIPIEIESMAPSARRADALPALGVCTSFRHARLLTSDGLYLGDSIEKRMPREHLLSMGGVFPSGSGL